MRRTGAWLTVVLMAVLPLKAGAQDTLSPSQPASVAVPAAVETHHSANKALLLSLLPGAGQVYNRQAWKIPIIYGAFAGVGYFIHYNYTRMAMFKDEYLYRVNNGRPSMENYASYPDYSIYNLYNSYNRNFQLSVIIAVGVYALNLIDAYVFGHLFEFRIDDDLTMNFTPSLQPSPLGWYPTVGLNLTF